MKRAIVVGTGAGGAMAARELARGFEVTVLEAGPEFRRFDRDLGPIERLRASRLLFDPRLIQLLFPAMRVTMAQDRMALVYGMATGGTTTLATANALRADEALLGLGIDLAPEFDDLSAELPISAAHERRWRPVTRELFAACEGLGLAPAVTPKLVDYERCNRCGRCVLGCPTGAKWDSRRILEQAVARGARLSTKVRVERVVTEGAGAAERATGVMVRREGRRGVRRGFDSREFIPADLVVLPGAVVVRERHEIQPLAPAQLDELGRAEAAVAVDGVHVQVAREHHLFLRGQAYRDRHVDPAPDLVQPQGHRPPARTCGADRVAGLGLRGLAELDAVRGETSAESDAILRELGLPAVRWLGFGE